MKEFFTAYIKPNSVNTATNIVKVISSNDKRNHFKLLGSGWTELVENDSIEKVLNYAKEFYNAIEEKKICKHCESTEGSLAEVTYYSDKTFKTVHTPKVYICEQCAAECDSVKWLN